MNFLAPSLAGLALLLVAASAAADPALDEPGAAVAEAPSAIAVRVIPSPWEPPPKPAKVRIPRSRVKRGLLIGSVAGFVVGGALLAGGAELVAHPPYDRSCLVAIFGCPRRSDYFPAGALLGVGATFAAAGVALGSVGLSLAPRHPDEQPPRAALSVGQGSARVSVAF